MRQTGLLCAAMVAQGSVSHSRPQTTDLARHASVHLVTISYQMAPAGCPAWPAKPPESFGYHSVSPLHDSRQMRTVTPRAPMYKHTVGARTLDYYQGGQAADNTKPP